MHDDFTIFSDDQAITGSAESDNDILFPEWVGQGESVYLNIKSMEDFTLLTSLTVAVQQTTEADTIWASPEIVVSEIILLADLTQGSKSKIRFLPNIDKPRVRLYYTVTGTDADAGSIFAAVVAGEDFPVKDGMYYRSRNTSGDASTA